MKYTNNPSVSKQFVFFKYLQPFSNNGSLNTAMFQKLTSQRQRHGNVISQNIFGIKRGVLNPYLLILNPRLFSLLIHSISDLIPAIVCFFVYISSFLSDDGGGGVIVKKNHKNITIFRIALQFISAILQILSHFISVMLQCCCQYKTKQINTLQLMKLL